MDKRAENLDQAWRNFDPDIPLPGNSPFFVDYERRPIEKFQRALLRSPQNPMRMFMAGFRGSGKSTHLNRLAENPRLKDSFLIVKYSIRETCDFNDITITDLLVSLASNVIATLPSDFGNRSHATRNILDELGSWGERVEEKVRETARDATGDVETRIQAGGQVPIIGGIWAKLTSRIRLEASSRRIIRETIEPQLSDLIEKLNTLATAITGELQRPLLVIVDDTDKLEHRFTYVIFNTGLPNLASLSFHALYTVREFTFFSPDFPEIKAGTSSADMLRNVKVWQRGNREAVDPEGEGVLLDFIYRRMDGGLIVEEAAKRAALLSGGVFRQLAALMQIAIDHTIEKERPSVSIEDVEYAANELRKGLLRIFTLQHREALRQVAQNNTYPDLTGQSREEIAPLLLLLAILEYENHDNWYDVNPILWTDFAKR